MSNSVNILDCSYCHHPRLVMFLPSTSSMPNINSLDSFINLPKSHSLEATFQFSNGYNAAIDGLPSLLASPLVSSFLLFFLHSFLPLSCLSFFFPSFPSSPSFPSFLPFLPLFLPLECCDTLSSRCIMLAAVVAVAAGTCEQQVRFQCEGARTDDHNGKCMLAFNLI